MKAIQIEFRTRKYMPTKGNYEEDEVVFHTFATETYGKAQEIGEYLYNLLCSEHDCYLIPSIIWECKLNAEGKKPYYYMTFEACRKNKNN